MIHKVSIPPLGRIPDERDESPSKGVIQEIVTGEESYRLATIPPKVWTGFKGLGCQPSIVANSATEPYDPAGIVRIDPFTNRIPYDWDVDHG